MTAENPSYGEIFDDVDTSEYEDVLKANAFTYWTYFVDGEAGVMGILGINEKKLSAFYISKENHLKLFPQIDTPLKNIQQFEVEGQLGVFDPSRESYINLYVVDNKTMLDRSNDDPESLLSNARQTLKKWQEVLGNLGVQHASLEITKENEVKKGFFGKLFG